MSLYTYAIEVPGDRASIVDQFPPLSQWRIVRRNNPAATTRDCAVAFANANTEAMAATRAGNVVWVAVVKWRKDGGLCVHKNQRFPSVIDIVKIEPQANGESREV